MCQKYAGAPRGKQFRHVAVVHRTECNQPGAAEPSCIASSYSNLTSKNQHYSLYAGLVPPTLQAMQRKWQLGQARYYIAAFTAQV